MPADAPDTQVRAKVAEQAREAVSGGIALFGAEAATWVLSFVMTVMMPRYLGAVGYGRLYIATSVTGIMAILVEFGLNSLVTREVARRPERATRYLVNAAVLKALLWVVASIIVASFVRLAEYPLETQVAVAVLALGVLISAESTLVVAILQANDRMRWIAISTVVEKATYVILGVTALLLGYGVIVLAAITVVGASAGLLLDLWWLRRVSHEREPVAWEGFELRALFRSALPFFSVAFFGAVYFRIDVIILSLMKSDAVVGQYGAAYRLFQATYILPKAFLFALLPVFCRLSPEEDDSLAIAAQKGLDLLLLLGLPIAMGIFALSDEIVGALYGAQFAASVPMLRLLSPAVALMYANGVFVHLLIATERQGKLAVTAAVAAGLNVAVNLVVIPWLGGVGAALATVVTEVAVICMNFVFLPRALTGKLRFGAPAKALLAAVVMTVALTALDGSALWLLVPVGVLVYAAGIVLLRALPAEDWEMLKSAVRSLKGSSWPKDE